MRTVLRWLLWFAAEFALSDKFSSLIEGILPVCFFQCFGQWFVISIKCLETLLAALVIETARWLVRHRASVLYCAVLLLPVLAGLAAVMALDWEFLHAVVSPWFRHAVSPVLDYLVSVHVPREAVALLIMAMMAPILLCAWGLDKLGDWPPMRKLGRILDRAIEDFFEWYDEHVMERRFDRPPPPVS